MGDPGQQWNRRRMGGDDVAAQKAGWEFQLSMKKVVSPKLGHKLHVEGVGVGAVARE
jgi:hypothetical protein